MPEPTISVIGNKASEQGAHDEGADFEGINRSDLPPMPEPMTVTVRGERTVEGYDVTLTPDKPFEGEPELLEGPLSIIHAQLTEDPELSLPNQRELMQTLKVSLQSAGRLMEISKRNPREALCWVHLEGIKQDISVTGDRIIIKQDTQESVYTCRTCKGVGHLKNVNCKACDGKGGDCPHCKCMSWGGEVAYSSGFQACERLPREWLGAWHHYSRCGHVHPDHRHRDVGRPGYGVVQAG